MIISTVLFFTSITPLVVSGAEGVITLNYYTTLSDTSYNYRILSGDEYIDTVTIDTTKKQLVVKVQPFVFGEGETGYSTRNIEIFLGNDSYGDVCNIIQVKSKPVLLFEPKLITTDSSNVTQHISFTINTDDYDYTDLTLYQPYGVTKTKWKFGEINSTGGVTSSTTQVITDKIRVTGGSIISMPAVNINSSSGLGVAVYNTDGTYKGMFPSDTDTVNYITIKPYTSIYTRLVNDALRKFSGSGTITEEYDVVLCAENQSFGSASYSIWGQRTESDYIYSVDKNASGIITLNTIPNFNHDERTYSFVGTLPNNSRQETTITKAACDNEYITPFVEDKLYSLDPSPNNYSPEANDYWQVYCPDGWVIQAINKSTVSNVYTVSVDQELKRVYLLQNRSNIAPGITKYNIQISVKPSGASDKEYEAWSFTRQAQGNYVLDDCLDKNIIQVNYTGKKSTIINITNSLKVEKITSYKILKPVGISTDKILVSLNQDTNVFSGNYYDGGTISIGKLPINESLTDKIATFTLRLTWGTTATHDYKITVVQAKNTTFNELPISEDTYYTISNNDLYYRLLELESESVLYTGKIYPSATNKIKINDIVKDYININKNPFTSVFVNNNNYYNILLQTSPDGNNWTNQMKYYFYYNYADSFELTNKGLISAEYQVIDYFSPYQYFISSKMNANTFDTYDNVYLQAKHASTGNLTSTEFPKDRGTVISGVLSCILYKQINIVTTTKTFYYNQKCVDSDWVLYYINEAGGWNWMIYDGKNIKGSTVKNNSYLLDNKYTVTYKNDITTTWDLSTKYLTDEQSKKLEQIYKSPCVYMQELAPNTTPFRVNIDTKSYQIKTYMNQGKKRFIQTMKVSKADINEWLI